MDWFEKLFGFKEQEYLITQSQFEVLGGKLLSRVNQKSFAIGDFSTPSLGELRSEVEALGCGRGHLKVSLQTGDVRKLHQESEYFGSLFQVASQFNMLEMTSPNVYPEYGVTRYQYDHTQGPACAIAAGAATIYRNYYVPLEGIIGQRAGRQIDGLAGVGRCLSEMLDMRPSDLWIMRNGYALCSYDGLIAISSLLKNLTEAEVDAVRSNLRIGLHRDVEVTEGDNCTNKYVSQAFCSALPVAYLDFPRNTWSEFARLVLEAAYEATLLAGVLNAQRGASNVVLLTQLGGGAFGNEEQWIVASMERALRLVKMHELDVRIVSYRDPSPSILALHARIAKEL